jgi:DNA recombination protein RmuC
MNDPALWLGVLLGAATGMLAMWLIRAARDQTLRIELAVLREKLKSEDQLRQQLQGVFSELATDSLKNNNELFLQVARERLTRQQQEAMQSLGSLVEPIRTALAKTEAQIGEIEKDRVDSFATLKSQIESLNQSQSLLSRETRNLVTALRRPEVRGQWGEITLRRLVELSGMSAHVDFSEQPSLETASGTMRPDMIVHMPDQRDIVIDVKTPLDAYLAAAEAADDGERGAQLKRHAQNVAARVRELSSKQYWAQFERSPDFVVLFLPGDQFLSAALQESYVLMDEALRMNVVFATPSSLVALLKTVAFGWKQTALAQNADEVRRLGEDIYRRLAVFGDHLAKLGKSLGGSVDSFNKAVGSLEQSVLPATRRFSELGLRTDRSIEPLDPIASLTRTPRSQNSEDEPDDRPQDL